MELITLKEKKIVIIGGTTGMGFSAAKACIAAGATVVVVGKDEDLCKEAEQKLGSQCLGFCGDATHESTAHLAIKASVNHFGGFDGIYHVAGGSGRRFGDGPIHELEIEGWEKTMNLNLTSLMFTNKAAIDFFLERNQSGVILNMASVLAFSPSPEYFHTHAYAAAKAAVIGLSKSISSYYAKNNIRINVIAPGLIDSPMSVRAMQDEKIVSFIKTKQPLGGGRAGLPADLDGAAVFLLSDSASFITGQVLAIDGGWSVTEGQIKS